MLGRFHRYRVVGPSMVPALPDGVTVLADPRGVPAPGEIVVARHPSTDVYLVKRVTRVNADGGLFLIGEGTATSDSRDFGAIAPEAVLGVVRCTLP